MADKKSEEIDLSILGEDVGSLLGVEESASVETIESIDDLLETEKKVKDNSDTPKDEPILDDVVDNEPKDVIKKDVEVEKESPFVVFAQILDEKGLVDFDPKSFDDSEDGLVELFEKKVQKSIESYKESLHPKIKELLESYEDGVPLGSYLEIEANIEDYEAIPENDIKENVMLQKDLVRESLSIKGLTQEQIEKKIKRFIDGGVLEDEAIDAREEIIASMRLQKEQQRAVERSRIEQEKERQKNAIIKLKETIDKSNEIIKGMELTPKQKEQLYDGITKVDRSGKTQIKKIIEADPDFSLKVAYMALILNWDLTSLQAKSNTRAASRLKDVVDPESKFERNFSRDTGGSDSSKIDWGVLKRSLKNTK